ncbi:MAG: hypothetical protein HeimAB125_14950 [Candidatus Heimdallarchaeota archaeon AB_125]|nr:MAG: hypothetical protein HeimAB125_14950 [Candidatus Heimdallarchaeota archaeon AB_125]
MLLIVAAALANTDIYGQETDMLLPFGIVMTVGFILFALSFIPLARITALIKSKGQTTKLRHAPKRPRDELTECGECCSGPCWI